MSHISESFSAFWVVVVSHACVGEMRVLFLYSGYFGSGCMHMTSHGTAEQQGTHSDCTYDTIVKG